MDTVIAILELVGLVLVVIFLVSHARSGSKSPDGCGCGGGMPSADLSFSSPTGGCG
jgi:hypothetical protein